MHNKSKTNTELSQTMGSMLNNRSTTTEPLPQNGQQPMPLGGLNAFILALIFALDSVVVKTQFFIARMEVS